MKLDYKAAFAITFVIIVSFYYIYDIFFSTSNIENADVIIIGSGLAGLSSAVELYKQSLGRLNILILESQSSVGGNSLKATSGINLLSTPIQHNNSINDSFSLFYNDTIISGHNQSDASLVSALITHAKDLYSFYSSVDIHLNSISTLGGHSVARTHRPHKGTVGACLTIGMYNLLLHSGNDVVMFKMNTSVTDLIYKDKSNKVKGVYAVINGKYKKKIKAKAVILATGGYAYDQGKDSLLKEYAEHLAKFPTTNGKYSKGEGIKIARRIGADVVHMQNVQVHPTGFVDLNNRYDRNKLLAPELLRGVGGILLNQQGKRFCNELGTRDYVTQQIIQHCTKVNDVDSKGVIDQYETFIVLNKEMVNEFGSSIEFYISKGLIRVYAGFKAFAKEFNVDEDNLKKMVEMYKVSVEEGRDEFGKIKFGKEFRYEEEIYVGVVTPSIHYTMGGVRINENAEVIDKNGRVINGLFAAGEVTGGVHGWNRLGGNSLLECAVFGKIAGKSVYEYLIK